MERGYFSEEPSLHTQKNTRSGDAHYMLDVSFQDSFVNSLPARPYCTDVLCEGIKIRSREQALRCRHIQLNKPVTAEWIALDVDFPGAFYAAEDANLPHPNIICENPKNGHAHLLYRLASPVHLASYSRLKPLRWLAAIQRGLTKRVGGDPAYSGLMIKNPLSEWWRTTYLTPTPYSLAELDDWLFYPDKKYIPRVEMGIGFGRNCMLFDTLRKVAYSQYRRFPDERDRLFALKEKAAELNGHFRCPLGQREVRGIVRSIHRWVERNFSEEAFSELQRKRVNLRWSKVETLAQTKPWEELGVCRRTWERRRKPGLLVPYHIGMSAVSLLISD